MIKKLVTIINETCQNVNLYTLKRKKKKIQNIKYTLHI